MRKLFLHPLFHAGLALRLAALFLFLPAATARWYAPFMESSVNSFSWDPWHVFLGNGGAIESFPYGYAMWIMLLPGAGFCRLVGLPLSLGYGLTLLGADIALLTLLHFSIRNRPVSLLKIYWFSPVVLFATYWMGLNDLVPVVFLCAALLCVRERRMTVAGALFGAAVSAKLSMVLVLPFVFIYLFRNRPMRRFLQLFSVGLVASTLLFFAPFLFSADGVRMLVGNPEIKKLYHLSISTGGGISLFVIPIVYLMMLYLVWGVRRISYDLFHTLLGIAFFAVILLTQSSPGWLIWVVPMFVAYQERHGRVSYWIILVFGLLYTGVAALVSAVPAGPAQDCVVALVDPLLHLLGPWGLAMAHTGVFSLGCVLLWRIWRDAVLENEYFQLTRNPFVVGIAGDSGAGKDTFANAIKGVFGSHSVVHLSGDDYHAWDRQKPTWQVMTHLNPLANHLDQFTRDLAALATGKAIQTRHYDHATGKMSRPFRLDSNDIVIVSGLHALHTPTLRGLCNISVYLDIDEGLRRHFKIRRDVCERGHSLDRVETSIARRKSDALRFITPQKAHADLILSLRPVHPIAIDAAVPTDRSAPAVKCVLAVVSRRDFDADRLARLLIGLSGLHVDMRSDVGTGEVEMIVEGVLCHHEVARIARILFPDISELFDGEPLWERDVLGLMQLVTLAHIQQRLRKNLV